MTKWAFNSFSTFFSSSGRFIKLILSHRYFWLQQNGIVWGKDILLARKLDQDF